VKFHLKTRQGISTLSRKVADELRGRDPDYSQRDLVEAIARKEYPSWTLMIQVMTIAKAKTFQWNPFDITKVWPHASFPLIEVGVLELNEVPANYFADVEQAAFAPSHLINGIGLSPDKLLQGRLLAYPDAHRYRLGANYEQITVNRPVCPVTNYQRDGLMNVDGNGGDAPNYFPNSFDDVVADKNYREPSFKLESHIADAYDRNADDNDHYSQPGTLFRKVMSRQQQKNTIGNIVASMSGITGPAREAIIRRQLGHFYRADPELAADIAAGLHFEFKP
jgi:catalase